MERIGWFEEGDDNAVKTAAAVAEFVRNKEGDNTAPAVNIETSEGGVNMSETTSEQAESTEAEVDNVTAEEGAEVSETEVEATDANVEEAGAEESAEVEEAETDPDFEKMFDELKDSVKSSVAKTVEAVESRVSEATEAFEAKATEFEKGLNELRDELKAVRESREDVAKRLDALEKASAIKKSGEVETAEPVRAQKGIWKGAFFDTAD